MTVPASRPLYDRIIEVLQAADGLPEVGDGQAPDGGGQTWIVVHPQTERIDGPLGDHQADAALELQLSCWGAHRRMAQETRDRARPVLLDSAGLSIASRRVLLVSLLPGPTLRDDSTGSPSLWHAVDRYRLTTSPI